MDLDDMSVLERGPAPAPTSSAPGKPELVEAQAVGVDASTTSLPRTSILPSGTRSRGARTVGLVVGLVAVAGGIPLVVALAVLRDPHWYPALDLALIELRVRDVGTSNPPLVGAIGRFFAFGEQGSHPGPLAFWALWPFYKLFGGTAWALQAATVALNLVAMGLAVWIGHRRGGTRLAMLVALGTALLAQAYTAERLTSAWNPYTPLLWWVVFLLAVWSVLCDDLPLLPVAVFAGSFCAQAHVSYLALVVGLGILVAAAVGWRLARPSVTAARMRRGSVAGWGGGALVLLLVLWLPPLIEQRTSDLGNAGLLRENFTHPLGSAAGFGAALDTWLAHLNPAGRAPVESSIGMAEAPAGSPVPGALLLAVWTVAAVVAWQQRRARPSLWRLHLVVAVAAGLGLVAISRVVGELLDYLVLWARGTTLLMVLATVFTLAPWLAARSPLARTMRSSRAPAMGLAAALAVAGLVFTLDAADTRALAQVESDTLTRIVPDVAGALRSGELPDGTPVPGGGRRGRYLVRYYDTELGTHSEGMGLLLELERQGFDVGGPVVDDAAIGGHRARQLDGADATVNLVIGEAKIAQWRRTPGAVEVVAVDTSTPAERRRYDRLRDQAASGLRAAGLGDLADGLHVNILGTLFDPRTPEAIQPKLIELFEIGAPLAVFVAPTAATWSGLAPGVVG